MSESAQIDGPVETLARGASQNAMTHRDCFTRHAGKCAAADPEGFAHSAAAGRKSIEVEEERRQRAGYGRDGDRMEMSLWLEFRAYLCARCAPEPSGGHLDRQGPSESKFGVHRWIFQ